MSLNGTSTNCAGGIAYRHKYWLTGEEAVGGPDHADAAARFAERHGYLFQTPVDRGPDELEPGVPLTAAGRFCHEAAAVDQRTGVVYETEDPGSGIGAGFYRYTPDDADDLTAGGVLHMLAITGQPNVDLREGRTRGQALPVSWVRIEEPDPDLERLSDADSTFNQGWGKGGAKFNRLEGCWEDDGTIFFVSTSGGDRKNGDVNSDGYAEGFGQVWAFRPRSQTLTLVYESKGGGQEADSPDNLTVTPRGGLLACEDDASSAFADTHPLAPGIDNVNRAIGITRAGDAFEFAVNIHNGSELAGACFSPSGKTLFINLFGRAAFSEDPVEGMTVAITGPWRRGPVVIAALDSAFAATVAAKAESAAGDGVGAGVGALELGIEVLPRRPRLPAAEVDQLGVDPLGRRGDRGLARDGVGALGHGRRLYARRDGSAGIATCGA